MSRRYLSSAEKRACLWCGEQFEATDAQKVYCCRNHKDAARSGSLCRHRAQKYRCWFCNPRGWARQVLSGSRTHPRREGYKPANISIDGLVALRNKATHCVLCGGLLDWSIPRATHLHHIHCTGDVVGFTHDVCNHVEGAIKSLGWKGALALVKKLSEEFEFELTWGWLGTSAQAAQEHASE